jgi:hypothetical protein
MADHTQPLVDGKDPVMEVPNAFAGQASQPTQADLEAALGGAKPVWDKLIARLGEEYGITVTEWRCYSVKTGWSLRLKRGKRTILWFEPGPGYFRVLFILGAKALQAARESGLCAAGRQALDRAVRYPEGTGVRLLIKSANDVGAVKKFAAAKIEN